MCIYTCKDGVLDTETYCDIALLKMSVCMPTRLLFQTSANRISARINLGIRGNCSSNGGEKSSPSTVFRGRHSLIVLLISHSTWVTVQLFLKDLAYQPSTFQRFLPRMIKRNSTRTLLKLLGRYLDLTMLLVKIHSEAARLFKLADMSKIWRLHLPLVLSLFPTITDPRLRSHAQGHCLNQGI